MIVAISAFILLAGLLPCSASQAHTIAQVWDSPSYHARTCSHKSQFSNPTGSRRARPAVIRAAPELRTLPATLETISN
jgi:hypothetical protein